jgi:hypothetical protein
MKPDFYFSVLLPCVFSMTAFYFLLVGLRGIVAGKPFLISLRWLFTIMLLAFAPSFILQPFLIPVPRPAGELGAFALLYSLNPIVFTVLLVFMWFTLRGYAAFAVTDSSFCDGLVAALKNLDLPYEVTLSTMRLPSTTSEIRERFT